ncbi:hypothetical protein P43SY_007119 [Pythium insidiosum]|uniref:Apple domain-containing protein n=1 Tax=Pythium insidiosum TaxID=114742 RepID=A0AAD5M3W0_PYTIN|nr:hypothetical protein P43SY_007119 [Pythium insidiosum]
MVGSSIMLLPIVTIAATLPASTLAASLRRDLTTDAQAVRELEAMEYMAAMSPPPPVCIFENGFDYPGNDISNKQGPVESCCLECRNIGNCRAWSWSTLNGGTCWFKSTRTSIVVNPNVKSALFFYGYRPTCELIWETDLVGNDIGNKPSAQAEGCCDICKNTLGCRAYSWSNLNGGTCWLKSDAGQQAYKPGVKSGEAYPRLDGGSAIQCSPLYGVDYPGNDIDNKPSGDWSGCCSMCKSVSGCKAFTWTDHNGGTCWLKSAQGAPVQKPGAVSSLVSNTNQCSPLENDTDYVDNDIGNVQNGDANNCCSICRQRGDCKAYSWSNLNGGTCWLKSAKGATVYKAGVKSGVVY